MVKRTSKFFFRNLGFQSLLPVVLGTSFVFTSPLLADNGLPWKTNKSAQETPPQIEGIGIDEKPGVTINKDLIFSDESGKTVSLGSYLKPGRPIVLSPVYYQCPQLCNFHLNGVFEALKNIPLLPGQDFELVAVSFDPKETPDLAQKKKTNYMNLYGKPAAAGGVHFLTGSSESIKTLMEQVGFKYKWDVSTDQWAHSSAAILITPDGKISRYLHGIVFDENTMRLSLVETSSGKIGQVLDRVLLFCFQYDPQKKGYAFYVYNITRVVFGFTVFALIGFLISFYFRQRREAQNI